jgi:hypothetical protein
MYPLAALSLDIAESLAARHDSARHKGVLTAIAGRERKP